MQETQYIEINEYGSKFYYKDKAMTILHRIDGPAVEYADGDKVWWVDGKCHRLDGPAVEYADGDKVWYIDGKRHRIDGHAVEYADGSKEWYIDGKRHRIDGHAVEYADGDKAWWVDGKHLSEDEFFRLTDWREDQHIVDLRFLSDMLAFDVDTATEHLKTNALKLVRLLIEEMLEEAMKVKRANGFLG